LWMLVFLMPADVSRNLMTPFLGQSPGMSSIIASSNSTRRPRRPRAGVPGGRSDGRAGRSASSHASFAPWSVRKLSGTVYTC